jgi:uncharacterized protein YidB (DUF937 family)
MGRGSLLPEVSMGLLDGLRGALGGMLGQAEAQVLPELLSKALAGTSAGSLQGLLDKLRQAGLGPQVASWLGSGPNQPITAAQLETALGDDVVERISMLNMPPDQIFGFLAEHLPAVIDRLSPQGMLQPS